MDWDNCMFDDAVYAELKKRVAAAQGDEPYTMKLVREDYVFFAEAWNQGIDSHLEALTERSTVHTDNYDAAAGAVLGKAHISIHPEELPVLIRRLFEGGDESGLASGILSTLEIE
jgi:hypothetical protein